MRRSALHDLGFGMSFPALAAWLIVASGATTAAAGTQHDARVVDVAPLVWEMVWEMVWETGYDRIPMLLWEDVGAGSDEWIVFDTDEGAITGSGSFAIHSWLHIEDLRTAALISETPPGWTPPPCLPWGVPGTPPSTPPCVQP